MRLWPWSWSGASKGIGKPFVVEGNPVILGPLESIEVRENRNAVQDFFRLYGIRMSRGQVPQHETVLDLEIEFNVINSK